MLAINVALSLISHEWLIQNGISTFLTLEDPFCHRVINRICIPLLTLFVLVFLRSNHSALLITCNSNSDYSDNQPWMTLYQSHSCSQGCALTAPGRLRRLTFGLGRLKKKSSRPSRCLDFGLCENPKQNHRTYWNGTERNKKKLPCAPTLPLARKTKALKAHQ